MQHAFCKFQNAFQRPGAFEGEAPVSTNWLESLPFSECTVYFPTGPAEDFQKIGGSVMSVDVYGAHSLHVPIQKQTAQSTDEDDLPEKPEHAFSAPHRMHVCLQSPRSLGMRFGGAPLPLPGGTSQLTRCLCAVLAQ